MLLSLFCPRYPRPKTETKGTLDLKKIQSWVLEILKDISKKPMFPRSRPAHATEDI